METNEIFECRKSKERERALMNQHVEDRECLLNEYIVQQFIRSDPNERGHWYECRRVKAWTYREAFKIAFPDGKPRDYRLTLA